MKEIRLLSLLLVITLFVQNAGAAILPYSSHYQGRSYYPEGGANTGHIDFAVYDTLGVHGNEWTGAGFDAPGADQYIYAYQIFNYVGAAIEHFTISGIDPGHELIGIDTMNSRDPWVNYLLITAGVAPTNEWPNTNLDETEAKWEFAGGGIAAGEYSWFLVFSSDNDWVPGEYEVQPAGGFPVQGNPEPCTLALLGIGSVILFTRRRKSV